jgi:3' exoribonuclease, RNase T-like
MATTIYASFDVETDGPNILKNSMLAFGVVLCDSDGTQLCSYRANILPRDGAVQDNKTMAWWMQNGEAWSSVQAGARGPDVVMREFVEWLDRSLDRSLEGRRVVWGSRPASFDWPWLRTYCLTYADRDIGHSCECISSRWRQRVIEKGWSREEEDMEWTRLTEGVKLTHDPLDDSIYQSRIWLSLTKI